MFVGRETELNILNNLYLKDQFELVIITGRKRTGKTRLLSEYIKDKPGIFFTAIEGNKKLNLKILSEAIQDFENSTSFPPTFDSFSIALNNIFELSLTERFVFIIDEFPYLAQSDPSFSSLLQMMIDKYREKSKMMIILSGSSISFMENKVIAYKAPLYGRLTTQIKLKPLSFAESLPYFKKDNIEKVTYYGIYGGTPYYLNQINPDNSIEENIKTTFLFTSSFLLDEPNYLLKQEVFELNNYLSVLTAIAEGATKLSEIASKADINNSTCAKIVNKLIKLNLIKKEYPFKEKRTKKNLYRLNDNAFKFWFRFVPSNLSLISRGLSDRAYQRIDPYINEFLGSVFEDIAKE